MANTKVSFTTYEGENLKSYLVAQVGATGTPNISGYTTTDVLDPGLYLFTVPENLVGEFSVKALDSASGVVFRGYVTLANDTNTYRCYDYTNIDIDYDQISAVVSAQVLIPANSLPQISGMNVTLFNGVTWNLNISGIGLDADNFYFTLKSHGADSDIDSVLQLDKSGVKYFQNAEQNNTSGILTYSTNNNGTINIFVNPVITSQINAVKYSWDIKAINTNNVNIRSFGSWHIKESITDAYE